MSRALHQLIGEILTIQLAGASHIIGKCKLAMIAPVIPGLDVTFFFSLGATKSRFNGSELVSCVQAITYHYHLCLFYSLSAF